jgi:hypothetical protein
MLDKAFETSAFRGLEKVVIDFGMRTTTPAEKFDKAIDQFPYLRQRRLLEIAPVYCPG